MTRAGIVAFTQKGGLLGRRLLRLLDEKGYLAEGFLYERHCVDDMQPFSDVNTLTPMLFEREDIIVFVGACGIAVRALAPCLKHKMEDPGVVVVDECGRYAVSLLSGHVGGANAFAYMIAGLLGAEPVVTTATDRNGLFAADTWAAKNGLRIVSPAAVKEIASRILSGEKIGFYSDFPVAGIRPPQLTDETGPAAGIVVSYGGIYDGRENVGRFPITCPLIPMDLTVGMGCKKGKTYDELAAFLDAVFAAYRLRKERIGKLCSIADKAQEEGLLELAKSLRVPFETFPAERLMEADGSFAASDFVKRHVGADNVCERSACLGSGGGSKLIGRQACDGMTIAVYRKEPDLTF